MNNIINSKVINKKLGFSLMYNSKEALTSRVTIEYEKAGFRIEEATISAYCSQVDLAEDKASVNNINIPVLYGSKTNFTASKDDTKFQMTLSMVEYESRRDIYFSCGQGTFKALESNAYVDRATYSTGSSSLKYTNSTEVPLIVTHCTVIGQNSTGRDTSVAYFNEADNSDIIGAIVYPGETIEFYNTSTGYARYNAFLVLKEVYQVTNRIKTKRQTVIRQTCRHTSQRNIVMKYMVRIRGTKRKVATNTETRVRHTRRYVSKRAIKILKSTRQVALRHNTKLKPSTKRIVVNSVMTRIRGTKRKVAMLTETKVRHTRRYISKNSKKVLKTTRNIVLRHSAKLKPFTKRIVTASTMVRIRGTRRKVAALTEAKVRHTRRYVIKRYNKSLDVIRDITNIFESRFYYDTKREVIARTMTRLTRVFRRIAANTETKVRHTRRIIRKKYTKLLDTNRKMTQRGNAKVLLGTKRIVSSKFNRRLGTKRRVTLGPQSSTIWLDTKLITLNTIKSKGPLLRKTSNNVSTSIPNTLRPVVWIYKENDGHPIDLDTSRTIHKSINPKVKTLRRVEHDFYYTTAFATHRNISNSISTSISSNRETIKETSSNFESKRQLIKNYKLFANTSRGLSVYANGSILTIRKTSVSDNLNIRSDRKVIDYGHSKLRSIRRVSKDNCICCNALTNRRVITDTQTVFNSNRKVVASNKILLNTSRLTALNYISGYAFTKRHISSNIASNIDSYRFITHVTNPKLASLRKTTVFDWFRNPTTRTTVNEAHIENMTERKVISDTFVTQDTSRSLYRKIEPILRTKREVIKSIDQDVDTKRRVAAEISNDIDATKKIAAKYIYLNKGERLIVKSTDKDIDAYREVRKAFVNAVDTVREVESDNIGDTLSINFEFKHGSLYETERCFYKANK